MTTLLLAEHDNKSLKDATNKALSAAKQMGGDVHVLVAGSGAKAVADAAAKLDGVAKVLLADAPAYEHALAEPIAALCREDCPGLCVVCGADLEAGPHHHDDDVDPRLEGLRAFMVDADTGTH